MMDSILDHPEESESSPSQPSLNFDLSTSLLASQPKSLARNQLRQSHTDYTKRSTMLSGIGKAREEDEDQLMMEAGSGPGKEAVIRASLAASGPSQYQDQEELLDIESEDGSIILDSSDSTILSLSQTIQTNDSDDLPYDTESQVDSSLGISRCVTPIGSPQLPNFDLSPLQGCSPTARLSLRSQIISTDRRLETVAITSNAAQRTPSRQVSLRRTSSSSSTTLNDLPDTPLKPSLLASSLDTMTPIARGASPTQEEMDAFFGFVDPNARSVSMHSPSLPASRHQEEIPTLSNAEDPVRQSASPPHTFLDPPSPETISYETARNADPAPTEQTMRESAHRDIGNVLDDADDEISQDPNEKRLSIISSLQRIALTVLEQCHSSAQILACPSLVYDRNFASAAASTVAQNIESSYIGGDVSSSRESIEVVLARRGGRPSGENLSLENAPAKSISRKQTLTFPRKLGKGANVRIGGRGLACFLRVVELVLEELIEGKVSTKRDLYYRDVALFRRQQIVDSIIEDLAATLRIRRNDLNVVASAKGLFSGSIKLFMADGSERTGSLEGTSIPPIQMIARIEAQGVDWVLVVEKDAVFQSLSTGGIVNTGEEIGKGVLITGKGYPDVATRELVKRLADDLPSASIMFLVDADPHGIEIMSTWVLGSSALSHDSSNLAIGLDRATWLGLRPTRWDEDGIARNDLIPLSPLDRRKAISMSKRDWMPEEWRRELEYMLHLNRKAEIETLASSTKSQLPTSQNSTDDSHYITLPATSISDFVVARIRRICTEGASEETTKLS